MGWDTQLAKHNGDEGDDRHDKSRGRQLSNSRRSAQALQPSGQVATECGLANDAVEHANGGDANLDGGQKLGRILKQAQCGLRAFVAGFRHRRQARFFARRQGHLRHGKQAIEQG
jgi:hypothetical protein